MSVLRLVAILLVFGLGFYLSTEDSHHTNVRYLLWKHHIWHDPEYRGIRYFNVDYNFRLSLYGKTKAEVEWWFPELRPEPEDDPNDKYYGPSVHQPGFFWIGHGLWAIIFKDDKVKEIRSFEGS